MAKMFYTIEEVAEKLGKTEDEVKEMAKSGQIQEFRDRDKLMFKVEQINLIAGGDDDDDIDDDLTLDLSDSGGASGSALPLSDTDAKGGSGIALSDTDSGRSGSGIGLTDTSQGKAMGGESDKQKSDSREGTGISVFDTDHGEESGERPAGSSSGSADLDAEQTQLGDDISDDDDLGLESVGSGSGLLDLTKESEDTALGAELLEEVYSSDDSNIEMPAGASGLFEATPESEGGEAEQFHAPAGAGVATYSVAYDGSGSGLGVGMMVGALIALICAAIIGIVGLMGATPQLAMNFAENLMIWAGGLAGVVVILGAVGWFIGRASE